MEELHGPTNIATKIELFNVNGAVTEYDILKAVLT